MAYVFYRAIVSVVVNKAVETASTNFSFISVISACYPI